MKNQALFNKGVETLSNLRCVESSENYINFNNNPDLTKKTFYKDDEIEQDIIISIPEQKLYMEPFQNFSTSYIKEHCENNEIYTNEIHLHLKKGLEYQFNFEFEKALECYQEATQLENSECDLRVYLLLTSVKIHLDLPIEGKIQTQRCLENFKNWNDYLLRNTFFPFPQFEGSSDNQDNILDFTEHKDKIEKLNENYDKFLNILKIEDYKTHSEYYYLLSISFFLFGCRQSSLMLEKKYRFYLKKSLKFIFKALEYSDNISHSLTYSYMQALILEELGKNQVAIQLLSDVMNQKESQLKGNIFNILVRLEKDKKMMKNWCIKGIKANVEYFPLHYSLARIYQSNGQLLNAMHHMKICFKYTQNCKIMHAMAKLHMKLGNFEESEKMIGKLYLNENVTDQWRKRSYITLAELYEKQKNYAGAKHKYLKALEFGFDPILHNCLGCLYQNHIYDYEKAKYHFTQIADKNAKANYTLGVICQNFLNQPHLAENYYSKAIMLQKDYADAYYGLAYLHQEQFQNKREALRLYRQAVQYENDFYEAYYAMGLLYQQFGSLRKAEKCYKFVIQYCPTHASGHLALGLLYSEHLHNSDKALEHYKSSITLVNHPDVYYAYGLLLQNDFKDYVGARRQFEACLNADASYVDVNYALGLLLKTVFHEYDLALDYYYRTVKLDPNYVRAYQALGIILKNHFEDYENARIMYEKALSLDHNRANSHYAYAILLSSHLDQTEKAMDFFANSIVLEPSNENCWRYMEQLLQVEKKLLENTEKFDSWRNSFDLLSSEESFKEKFDNGDIDEKVLFWSELIPCARSRAEYLYASDIHNFRHEISCRSEYLSKTIGNFITKDITLLICESLLGNKNLINIRCKNDKSISIPLESDKDSSSEPF